MSVSNVAPLHPKHVWVQRFGIRLMQLQPHMSALMAAKHAVDTFNDSSHLDPDDTAIAFVNRDQRRDEDDSV